MSEGVSLSVSEEDLKFFNELFVLLKSPMNKEELEGQLLKKNLKNREFIEESLRYLIMAGAIKQIGDRLVLLRIPNLQIIERASVEEFPKVLVTLPPYNIYGLSAAFKKFDLPLETLQSGFSKIFHCADESIYICSPFLDYNGIERFIPLLIDKAKRGVEIKILTRQISKTDPNSRHREVSRIIKVFESNSVKVAIRNYHYSSHSRVDSSIHAKMIICDLKLAYVGSGELRRNSFEKNFEVGVVLKGEKAKEIAFIFERLFTVSEEVNWEE